MSMQPAGSMSERINLTISRTKLETKMLSNQLSSIFWLTTVNYGYGYEEHLVFKVADGCGSDTSPAGVRCRRGSVPRIEATGGPPVLTMVVSILSCGHPL